MNHFPALAANETAKRGWAHRIVRWGIGFVLASMAVTSGCEPMQVRNLDGSVDTIYGPLGAVAHGIKNVTNTIGTGVGTALGATGYALERAQQENAAAEKATIKAFNDMGVPMKAGASGEQIPTVTITSGGSRKGFRDSSSTVYYTTGKVTDPNRGNTGYFSPDF